MVARRRAVAHQKPQLGFFFALPAGAGVAFVAVVTPFSTGAAELAGGAALASAVALGAASTLGALDAATAAVLEAEGGGAALAGGAGSRAPSIAPAPTADADDEDPREMKAIPDPTRSTAAAPKPSHVAADRAGLSGGGIADWMSGPPVDVMPPPAGVAVALDSGEPVISAVALSARGRGVNAASSGDRMEGNEGDEGNDGPLGEIARGSGNRSSGASPSVILRTATGAVIGSLGAALGAGVNGLGVNGAGVNSPGAPDSGAGYIDGEPPPRAAAAASTASAENASAISRADWKRPSRSRANARAK